MIVHLRRLPLLAGMLLGLSSVSALAESIDLQPGQWDSQTQTLINGKPLNPALDRMQQQILDRLKGKLTPEQLAEIQNKMHPAGSSSMCITAEQIRSFSTEQWLKNAMSTAQSAPWICQMDHLSVTSGSATGDYRCYTPPGGKASGKLMATWDLRHYSIDIQGTGNAVHNETGEVVVADQIPMQSKTEGHWVSSVCRK